MATQAGRRSSPGQVMASSNPFRRSSLASAGQAAGETGLSQRPRAPSSGRASLDVDAFKRLLLTGSAQADETLGDGEAAGGSRSSTEIRRRSNTQEEVKAKGPPPPPSSRHGRLISEPTIEKANQGDSDPMTEKTIQEDTEPARQRPQLEGMLPRRYSQISNMSGDDAIFPSPEMGSKAGSSKSPPPIPPVRRAGSIKQAISTTTTTANLGAAYKSVKQRAVARPAVPPRHEGRHEARQIQTAIPGETRSASDVLADLETLQRDIDAERRREDCVGVEGDDGIPPL